MQIMNSARKSAKFSAATGIGLFVSLAMAVTLADAQTWPNKTVTFVNPFPAGGGTDTFARPIAAKLSQQMGPIEGALGVAEQMQ